MKKILLFLILSLASSLAFGQYTAWHRVNDAIEANDIRAAKAACENVIMTGTEADSILLTCRYILAEIDNSNAIESQDSNNLKMENVYRGYSFFRDYIKQHPEEADSYISLISKLKHTYDSILAADRGLGISEGVYISAEYDNPEKKTPAVAFSLAPYGEKVLCTILPMCDIANISQFKKANIEFPSEIYISDDNPDLFKTFWGNEHAKNPNTNLAQNTLDQAYNFQREMTGTLQSGNYRTGDYLAGTAATAAVTAGLVALANVFSSGAVNSHAVNFEWLNSRNGTLALRLSMVHKKIKTGQDSPEIEDLEANLRMFKIYPHHEVFFYDPKTKSILTSANSFDKLDYLKAFHPAFRDEVLPEIDKGKPVAKLKKPSHLNTSAINPAMYKRLFVNAMLKEALEANDTTLDSNFDLKKYEYTLRTQNSNWFRVCLEPVTGNGPAYYFSSDDCSGIICEKQNGEDSTTKSFYYIDGPVKHIFATTRYDKKKGLQKGWGEITYANGTKFMGYTEDFIPISGTLLLSDNVTFEGNVAVDQNSHFCIPQNGTLTQEGDGFSCVTMYVDGTPDDKHTIKYLNGDTYFGQVVDLKPHGQGTITYADGKSFTGDFADGKPVVKEKPQKRKTRKKTRR